MTNYFLFNGEFKPFIEGEAVLPIDERATNFGDGVYEVIKIYNGSYYLMEEHLDRLYRSLKLIRIDFIQRDTMRQLLFDLLEKNNFNRSGHVYFQVSRGSAPRGHLFPENVQPNLTAYLVSAERPYPTMTAGVNAITVEDIRWKHCDIKSLNLLPNILAKQTAHEQGCYEAIQIRDGLVSEGSSSNIFVVKNGIYHTHPNCNLILPGIVKRRLLELCERDGVKVVEEAFTPEFLKDADEIFLSSSTSEITPIINVDGSPIGSGKPGPYTRKIQTMYANDAGVDIFF